MSLLLICVTPEWPVAPPVSTLSGQAAGWLNCGPLAAAVCAAPPPGARPEVSTITEFHAIVEHAHALSAAVPVRFGCLFESAEKVRQELRRSARFWLEAIERLRGRCEIGLRLPLPPVREALPATPGRRYLEQRRAGLGLPAGPVRAETVLAVRRVFEGSVIQEHQAIREIDGAPWLDFSFLVERRDLKFVRESALGLCQEHRALLTGPWPPYHFAPELAVADAAC